MLSWNYTQLFKADRLTFSVSTVRVSDATWVQTAVLSAHQTKRLNISVTLYSRGSQGKHVPCECYLVSTDDHQSAPAVLCSAGQELSLLLWEGEDSEYCCVTTLLPKHLPQGSSLIWRETLWKLVNSLWSGLIFQWLLLTHLTSVFNLPVITLLSC